MFEYELHKLHAAEMIREADNQRLVRAVEPGAVGILGRASINLPSTLESSGRSEEAVAVAEEGVAFSRQRGPADTEVWVRSNQAESLFSLGRWSEADATPAAVEDLAQSHKARGLLAVAARSWRWSGAISTRHSARSS
ncbi:hypothetical protein ACIOWG_15535 [Streptomyces sp. NPDC087658]|uniref:hypothetical protein n=1 Tax=Streptomyces sp. NPDC087658 TaxID=3365800 RepID=UPI0037F7F87D